MLTWLLNASEVLALAVQNLMPARLRGQVSLTIDTLALARSGQSVHLLLTADGLLVHRIDLPDQSRRANPAWLSARIETLSPWEPDACLWDTCLAGSKLDLAILPLAPVAEAERLLTLQGARLVGVSAGRFWFRRDIAQLRRWRDRLALSVGLVTVLALALASVGLQAFWQAQDRATLSVAALDRSSERLKEGAGPAQAALDLLQRKSGSLALALAHLAQALPQDSYLTTLSATREGIDLSGHTLTPEGIIPALSADPVFATVNFAGPAAHDLVSGSYSFSIHTTLGALP